MNIKIEGFMKMRVYRSIVFWGGILVILFIIFVWRESLHQEAFMHVGKLSMRNRWGGVYLEWSERRSMDTIIFSRSKASINDVVKSVDFNKPVFRLSQGISDSDKNALDDVLFGRRDALTIEERINLDMDFDPPSGWAFFLPYWVMLSASAPLWFMIVFCKK